MPVVRNEAPWGFPLEIETDKRIEVLVDKFDFSPVPDDTIRIVVMDEPVCAIYNEVKARPECYTYVLTFLEDVLRDNMKARFFRGVYGWCHPDKEYPKKFAISTVVGAKNNPIFEGYAIRHELLRKQEQITTPKNFYLSHDYHPQGIDRSKFYILGDGRWDKEAMFDCMFHVCIENTSIPNYFSEKLIDCFLTHTVPIYRGCPNIGDFFKRVGVIQCDTTEEIISACNGVTPELYERLSFLVEENYQTALKYFDYPTQLKETILKLL